MQEAARLASYLQFYWPVSYVQTRALLDMARFAPRPNARILDLGSGPGPCALAAADRCSAGLPGGAGVSVVACDRSALALESAGRLAAAAGYAFSAVPNWNAAADPIPEGAFDVVVLGHVANELWTGDPRRLELRKAFLEKALSRLASDGVLVLLEPALLSTGREALALRDALAGAGWRVAAPCLRSGACPALAAEGQTCHSDFAWDPPRSVRELSARTGLDKDLVKTTAFVFSRSVPERADGGYRVVSEAMTNKAGRVRFLVCGEEGRFPLSAKPGEGFPAEKAFLGLRRSDRIVLTGAETRENGLGLGPATVLEIGPAGHR